MTKKIITINKEKCIGCGQCISACQENALALVDGKATLVREDHCDGLGNCLPVCPADAISFINVPDETPSAEKSIEVTVSPPFQVPKSEKPQRARQWPIQMKLVSPEAEFLDNSHLLVAADCTAFVDDDFFKKIISDKVLLIGCTKLDDIDYSEVLAKIIRSNNIKSISVARMEVPCCGGMERAVKTAIIKSGKDLDPKVFIVGIQGGIIEV